MIDGLERKMLRQKFWWYVVVKGGVIFGLLVLLPLNIVDDVLTTIMNGRIFSYNRFAAQQAAKWADIHYLVEHTILAFVFGMIAGCFWLLIAKKREK